MTQVEMRVHQDNDVNAVAGPLLTSFLSIGGIGVFSLIATAVITEG